MTERATPAPPSTETSDRSDLTLGLVGAALAVIAWGSAGVIAKHIDMGGVAIAVYRFGLYSIAVLVFMRLRGTPLRWRAIRRSMWGGIALGLDVALFFSAVKLTTVANATIIGALQPAVVGVVAWRLFGERITRRDIGLAVVALGGVVVVVTGAPSSAEPDALGDLMAVGALFAWSAYFIFSKQSKGVLTPTEYTAGTAIWTAVINAPLAVAFGQDLSWPSAQSWFWLVVLAFGAGVLGHQVMNWSLVRIPLWIGSTFTLLIPVTSSALAWIVFGESLTAVQVLAMAVVVAALALLVRAQTTA